MSDRAGGLDHQGSPGADGEELVGRIKEYPWLQLFIGFVAFQSSLPYGLLMLVYLRKRSRSSHALHPEAAVPGLMID